MCFEKSLINIHFKNIYNCFLQLEFVLTMSSGSITHIKSHRPDIEQDAMHRIYTFYVHNNMCLWRVSCWLSGHCSLIAIFWNYFILNQIPNSTNVKKKIQFVFIFIECNTWYIMNVINYVTGIKIALYSECKGVFKSKI